MRVTVIAIGTRGDVQPMLALAAGLRAAGHAVRFAGEANHERAALASDLEFWRLSGDSERFYAGPGGIALRERLEKPATEYKRFWKNYLAPSARRHLQECIEPCKGSDILVCQPWAGIGPALSEHHGIPCVIASVFPVPELPTREFPFPIFGNARADATAEENWRTWRRGLPMLRMGHNMVQDWRAAMGLARQTFKESIAQITATPHLLGYSPIVLPKAAEWPEQAYVTGYWFVHSTTSYQPPPELEEFLAAGEPPVVVGFGSHVGRNPALLTDLVLEALRISGQRGILILGWGGLKPAELPKTVFGSRAIPYDWLLPRTRALVHHGGSGTTAIALRMGTPQAITPFGYDQTFWAQRIARLGVGPGPAPVKSITPDQLAALIREVAANPDIRARAMEAGAAIRAEDGIANAVAAIERIASRRAVHALATGPC